MTGDDDNVKDDIFFSLLKEKMSISDKRLPQRENLDFQISCLYIGLPEDFFFSDFFKYFNQGKEFY